MADIIATREDCNGLKSGSFTSDLKRCVTKTEVENVGLAVSGWTGTAKQLVPYKYIYVPITYSLIISPSSWSAYVNDTKTFSAILITYENGTETNRETVTGVSWSSNNTNVVTINSSGLATAKASGSTTIEANWNGYTAIATVRLSDYYHSELTISPSSWSGYVNDTKTFSATVTRYKNGSLIETISSPAVTWKSSNVNIARIDSSGRATGYTSGSTIISATWNDDTSVTNDVVVSISDRYTYDLEVSPSSATLDVGDTKSFSAELITYINGIYSSSITTTNVTWTSNNTNYVTISSSGRATAKAVGSTTIKATWNSDSNVYSTASISVQNVITYGLNVQPSSATVDVNDTQNFTAYLLTYTNGSLTSSASTLSVTWSSDDTNIASVNTYGVVSVKSSGTATITATHKTYGVSATAKITGIDTYSYSLEISPSSATLDVGETIQFTATGYEYKNGKLNMTYSSPAVTWKSSNVVIARIDSNGRATGYTSGSTIISATWNDVSAEASLEINDVITYDLSISPGAGMLEVGDTQQFTATLIKMVNGLVADSFTTSLVTWISNNTNIVSINSSGLATAKASGSTNVIVTSSTYGVSAEVPITVSNKITYTLVISPSTWEGEVGDTKQYVATQQQFVNGNFNTSYNITPSWISDNTNIVSIDTNGLATAKASGSTIIRATKGTTLSATASATITEAAYEPTITYDLLISETSWKGDIGDTKKFELTYKTFVDGVEDASKRLVVTSAATWSSTVNSIVNVGTYGVAEIVGEGDAAVVASYKGLTVSATVHCYTYTYEVLGLYPSSWNATAGETQSFTLSVRKTREDGVVSTITNPAGTTWESTNTNVVRMNGSTATAGLPGSATIKATYNGSTASASVTVTSASVEKEHISITISFGEVYKSGASKYVSWYADRSLPCNVVVQLSYGSFSQNVTLYSGNSSGSISLGSATTNSEIIGIIPSEHIVSPEGGYEDNNYYYTFND